VAGSGVVTLALPESIALPPGAVVNIMCTRPHFGDATRLAIIETLVLLALVTVPSKRLDVNSTVIVSRVKTVTVPVVNVHVDPTLPG